MNLYRKLLILILSLFLCAAILINLGRFIDVTQKPIKSSVIVSLGGASGCRIKTALELYKGGLSTSGKIIYTGNDTIGQSYSSSFSRKEYLENNGLNAQNIIHIDKSIITNTMEEVFFIKKYMLKHNLKTVIFVSHPHHSRRISALAKYVADYDSAGLSFMVASCNPTWWDRDHYFMNGHAIKVTIHETLKLVYNFIKYNSPLIIYTKYITKQKNKEWEAAINRLDNQK